MTFTLYDPEVLADAELARERYMTSEAFQFDLADWLAEQASEFEFTRAFKRAFEAWLEGMEESE